MQNLATLLFDSASRAPFRPALLDERHALDYAALAGRVRRFADALLAAGLSSQGRVALFLDKSVDTAALLLAVVHAGGIVVPVNPKLKAQQVAYIVRDCGAELLVTTPHRLGELRPLLADAPVRVVLAGAATVADESLTSLTSLLMAARADAPVHRRIDVDAAAILYTSGSTGHPKGVVVSHRNLVAGCQAVNAYLSTQAEDAILALLPISFDAGLSQLSTGLAVGAKVVLHTPLQAQQAAAAVGQHGITSITAVPPLWSLLASARWEGIATDQVRLFANTGGHMNATLLAQLRQTFTKARPFLMYGLTEAFRSTYLDPAEVERRPGSIGKAIPNAEILVLRADGSVCDDDEPGELVHRGALVSMGYWNAPEKTAERFRPLPPRLADGLATEMAVWSGDIVRRDAEGFLYFVGRRDEMIKTSGYRISPTEIESVLSAAPGVRDAAAFGVPDGDIGDAIYATVAPSGDDFDRALVDAHCAKALPAYMAPRLVVLDQLPRSANGKIDRVHLRELCVQLHAETRAAAAAAPAAAETTA
ncbi:acyl-CoA ligase (AMP-forming), exosortase A system-associated [Ideonella sp.]|uniref:acyl-CoA ligase (AMP-forming), exosortase A system-associated n=1 Tax=Ideonella sp. TaxID=1929293 RepID=UPI0035AF9996